MFFIGQIHHMNYSSLLDRCVMNVPGRSAKELNDYFLLLMSITRTEGSAVVPRRWHVTPRKWALQDLCFSEVQCSPRALLRGMPLALCITFWVKFAPFMGHDIISHIHLYQGQTSRRNVCLFVFLTTTKLLALHSLLLQSKKK